MKDPRLAFADPQKREQAILVLYSAAGAAHRLGIEQDADKLLEAASVLKRIDKELTRS